MRLAPVRTPEVLWHEPPMLALARLPGTRLGHLGEPARTSPDAWAAAGAAVRLLHDAPLPPFRSPQYDDPTASLERECAWLLDHDVLPRDLVLRNREVAEGVIRPTTPVFTPGDLQCDHVFVEGGSVSGVLDWSDAGQGDAASDLAILTLGHPNQLEHVVAGYGDGVDLDAVRAHWSLRALTAIRWLVEHGFDPFAPGTEADVLRRQL